MLISKRFSESVTYWQDLYLLFFLLKDICDCTKLRDNSNDKKREMKEKKVRRKIDGREN